MKGENQSSQKRTSQTQVENQQIQSIWHQVCDLKPVHIGVRQVLASVFILFNVDNVGSGCPVS